jgi:outer membrane protein assembly factor BamB
MPSTKFVTFLLFFSLLVVPATVSLGHTVDPQEVAWELPPLQWTKDLESGYVSTAPLVLDDMMYVKVGGRSDSPGGPWDDGKGPGIYAFNTYTGEQIWRYEHNQSRSGFEISPPIHIWQKDLLINGWTSGNITAHNASSGELLWMYETERVSWGITGKPILIIGEPNVLDSIHISTETGVLGLSPNGSFLFQHTFPSNATGYRNGVGLVILSENFSFYSGTSGLFLATGDESGGFHTWEIDGGNFSSWDLNAVLNGSELKMRTPPFIMFPSHQNDTFGAGIIVQGSEGGELVNLQIDNESSLIVKKRVSLGIAPSIPVILPDGVVVTGDLNSVKAHCFYNLTDCDNFTVIDSGPVSGEPVLLVGNYNLGGIPLAVPHNTVDGYWSGHLVWWGENRIESSVQWDWHPQKAGWLTAGVGGTSEVMAAANDASWLEVRYFDDDPNAPISDADGHQNSENQDIESTHPTVTGLPLLTELLVVMTLVLSTAALAGGNMAAKRAGSLGILLVLLLLLPTLNLAWVTTVSDEGGDLETSRAGFPEAWNDSQVVCFEYPEDLWWDEAGMTIFLDADEGEITRHQGNNSRTCVGALEGHQTIQSATVEAAQLAGLEYTWDGQPLGMFVEDIGPAEGGDGDRWWLYWVDGKHGNLAVNLQPITNASVVEWRFL